ncbi:hypothetical protein SK128_018279, partial [Halocaridina rubra]
DSGLQEVKSSDLHTDVIVRTIKEANMNLLKFWITEKLAYALKHCIVCCGTEDMLDDVTMESLLEDLGTIVAELKRRKTYEKTKGELAKNNIIALNNRPT